MRGQNHATNETLFAASAGSTDLPMIHKITNNNSVCQIRHVIHGASSDRSARSNIAGMRVVASNPMPE